ncbi:hypothetical protein ACQP1U_14855 [Actinomycetota bacterium]
MVSQPTRIGTGDDPVWSAGPAPEPASEASAETESQGDATRPDGGQEAPAARTRVVRPGESWERTAGTGVAADQTLDDTDAGWGEQSSGRDADWYRSQRPPHWE